jgi:hypothetical protein
MEPTRLFAIVSWILLPTVMFGGYSLLRLLAQGTPWLTPARHTLFRAGHAHAGVLLAVSLVYYLYLDRTDFTDGLKVAACIGLLAGILAQSGGFFLSMAGEMVPGRLSIGTRVTILGALLLAVAVLLLVYGLIVA